MGEDSVMITHGILENKEGYILMGLLLIEPILPPTPEPKECWMDRRAYSLYQKKKLDTYLQEWK